MRLHHSAYSSAASSQTTSNNRPKKFWKEVFQKVPKKVLEERCPVSKVTGYMPPTYHGCIIYVHELSKPVFLIMFFLTSQMLL